MSRRWNIVAQQSLCFGVENGLRLKPAKTDVEGRGWGLPLYAEGCLELCNRRLIALEDSVLGPLVGAVEKFRKGRPPGTGNSRRDYNGALATS